MELKTCEFCGTEYQSDLQKCPLCGRANEAKPEQKKGKQKKQRAAGAAKSAGAAKKPESTKSGKNGKNGWKIASLILGILVLLGIAAFVLHMDFFDERFDPNGMPTLLDPQQSDPNLIQPPVLPESPAEPEMPAPVEPEPEPVDPLTCTGLTISQQEVELKTLQEKLFLTAVARPVDCKDPVVFTSSDETVATVNDTGMITGVGPGEAEITVTCGEQQQTCKVLCTFEMPEEETTEDGEPAEGETPAEGEQSEEQEKPEEGTEEQPAEEEKPAETPVPTLSSTDFTLFKKGEQTVLTVSNAPEGAAISYASSDETVAKVDANGTVTAVANGTANITVTVGDVKLTCIARCNLGETYTGPFKISHMDVTLKQNETFQLTLTDSTGKVVANPGWKASNNCVTINGNTIKGVAGGQCNVSVTYEGTTFSCIVRCSF